MFTFFPPEQLAGSLLHHPVIVARIRAPRFLLSCFIFGSRSPSSSSILSCAGLCDRASDCGHGEAPTGKCLAAARVSNFVCLLLFCVASILPSKKKVVPWWNSGTVPDCWQLLEVGRCGRVPSQLSRPNRVLHKKANFASSKRSESLYATG